MYGNFQENLRRATSFLYRRHARGHGPRHILTTDTEPLAVGTHRAGKPRSAARHLLVLAVPAFAVSALGLWMLHAHQNRFHVGIEGSDLIVAIASILLAVRSATARAPVWIRVPAVALSLAYLAGFALVLAGAWPF